MQQRVFNVSEVNQLVKQLIEGQPELSGILVRGELSNFKVYPSGHHYFTLKDGQSALRCVLFAGSARYLRFRPENGMKVVAAGRVSVYPRDGPISSIALAWCPTASAICTLPLSS